MAPELCLQLINHQTPNWGTSKTNKEMKMTTRRKFITNAGAGAVKKYAGVPPYDDTREYLRRVKILYRRYGQAL